MEARVDFDRYRTAGALVENFLPISQGGITRRPGTRYVSEVKDSTKETRIIRFEYSVEQSYRLELGDGYMRFYRNQGRIAVANTDAAITNGAFPSDVSSWTDESAGTGAISHDSTNDRMNLDGAGSGNEAIAEQAVTVTTTSVEHVLAFQTFGAPGDEITVRVGSASGGSQYLADTVVQTGYHCVSFTPTASPFYLQFENIADKTVQVDNVALLDNAALEISTPYAEAELFAIQKTQTANQAYLAHRSHPIYRLTRRAGTSTSWSFEQVAWQDGPYFDENITATTMTPGATSGLGVTMTASAITGINDGQGFLSTDVGRILRIRHTTNEPGWCVITAWTSTTVVTVDVIRAFNATTATATWSLGAWSETSGYPGALTFFEQRFYAAGTGTRPQTIWGSQSADIENMRPDSYDTSTTIEDDDGFAYTIAADDVNTIRWLKPSKALVIGTVGGEWIADSAGASITPTDIVIRRQTGYGSAAIEPVTVDNVVLFVQRAGRKIREFVFSFDVDSYRAPDMTILADHITASGLKEIAYQQEPESILWCVRNDGQLATLTYRNEQDVIGWSRQILGGAFGSGDAVVESVCTASGQDGAGQVASSDDRDEVWFIVKRTIDGSTVRYVEFLEGLFSGPRRFEYDTLAAWKAAVLAAQQDSYYADCMLTYDGAATDTITGLDHLEGQTVKVLADGAVHPDCTVASGSITLDYDASVVHAGLGYRHRFIPLKLDAGARAGTAVGKTKRIHKLGFVLLDTASFQLGQTYSDGRDIEFRTVADAMDTAVPLFTGEYVDNLPRNDWDRDPRFLVQGDAPTPCTILAMLPELITNEGR